MADANDSKRVCKKCLGIFPLSDFKYRKDRHKSVVCVHCFKARKTRERKAFLDRNPNYFKDYLKDYLKGWKEKNPGYHSDKFKKWREKNIETVRLKNSQYMKLWRARNPEEAMAIDKVKQAKRRAAEGRHSAFDVKKIFLSQKKKCANCKTCIKRKYHLDHIIPLAKGGTNWPDNIQLLCPECNMRKGRKDPFDWANENGRLL